MSVILVLVYLGGFIRHLPSPKEAELLGPVRTEILVLIRSLLWPIGNLVAFGVLIWDFGKIFYWMLFDRDRLFREVWLDKDEKKT